MRSISWLPLLLAAGCAHTPAPHPAQWTYDGETGPAHWGELVPACAKPRQSPIDLGGAVHKPLPAIAVHYQPSHFTVVNDGHNIVANAAPGSFIEVGGVRHELTQFHFHHPSEHVIDGKHYPLELHVVNKSAAGELDVLAVFVREGAENATLAPLFAALPVKGGQLPLDNLQPAALLPSVQAYYTYTGTLTVPPCSETHWLVLPDAIEVSAAQIAAFDARISHNNRPLQPTEGRDVSTTP